MLAADGAAAQPPRNGHAHWPPGSLLAVKSRLRLAADSRAWITWRQAAHLRSGLAAALALAGSWATLSLVHEVSILAVAPALRWLTATDLARAAVEAVRGDEVHADIALKLFGAATPLGLAVVGPLGEALRNAWPTLFAAGQPGGPWLSARFGSATSVVAFQTARLLIDAVLIVAGLALLRRGLRRNRRVVALSGAGAQAYGFADILLVTPGPEEMVLAVMPLVATKVLGLDRASYDYLASSGRPWLAIGCRLALLFAFYSLALLLPRGARAAQYLLRDGWRRLWRKERRASPRATVTLTGPPPSWALSARRRWVARWQAVKAMLWNLGHEMVGVRVALGSCALATMLYLAPAHGQPSYSAAVEDQRTKDAFPANVAASAGPPVTVGLAGRASPTLTAPGPAVLGPGPAAAAPPVAVAGEAEGGFPSRAALEAAVPPAAPPVEALTQPSVVAVDRTRAGYRLLVNGLPEHVRGVGYNPPSRELDVPERRARLDRDFAQMHAANVNLITGWDQAGFDADLLDAAARHGVGVAMPFTLIADRPYWDPQEEAQQQGRLQDWVLRYRAHPAVRMWAVGNEVLHSLRGDRSGRRQWSFSHFLVRMADVVHQLDPNHPVVYSDAEDVYLQPLLTALRNNPADRPWFIYGMNFYTERLATALRSGPAIRSNLPLLISEFAPTGLRAPFRPEGYRRLWRITRIYPDRVLGACAYVWSTDGPEPLDSAYGLVDSNGRPVDGSLSMLAYLYGEDLAATQGAP